MGQGLYTIGYAGFPEFDDFVVALRGECVALVADVRSVPYTQRYPYYSGKYLEGALARAGIEYRSFGREFGARQEDRRYYPNGYLDFSLFSRSEAFRSGMEAVWREMDNGRAVALMCSEIDPIRCHRAILVARAFHEDERRACEVVHLMPGGKRCTQTDIEERLLEALCRNWAQVSLFDPEPSREAALERAYRIQNQKIGFSLEEGQ